MAPSIPRDAMKKILNELEKKGLSIAQGREIVLETIANATAAILDGRSLRSSLKTISVDEWYQAIKPSILR